MPKLKATGRCLCGAVTVHAAVGTDAGACHCDICRKWGGGPLFALDCRDVRMEGDDNLTVYETTEWADRAFCGTCGTHVYIRVKGNGRYIMPAGLFDVESELRFDHQIFIDKKPGYYTFADETKNMTGEEVFAEATKSSG